MESIFFSNLTIVSWSQHCLQRQESSCNRLAAPRTVEPPRRDLVLSHVSGRAVRSACRTPAAPRPPPPRRPIPTGGRRHPNAERDANAGRSRPGPSGAARHFHSGCTRRLRRAHNAPRLPPSQASASFFPRAKGRGPHGPQQKSFYLLVHQFKN